MGAKTLMTLFTSVAFMACAAQDSSSAQNDPFHPISEAELAELVPDFVDAQSMPWLAGTWGVLSDSEFKAPGCEQGGFMELSVSGYVFEMISEPEPTKKDGGKTRGTVNVSKGNEPGFFNLTPPDWEDAYFRLKPRSENRLTAHLYSFSNQSTEWLRTNEFEFERCED